MRQGVTLPETPRERRELAGLAADLEGSPLAGRPLPLRLRNFRPSTDRYLASLGGPLAYMLRLRQIDRLVEGHEARLDAARGQLILECDGDEALFGMRWQEIATGWSLDEVNDLIDRHNRWYPVESNLPMDPRTRDYALVNGESYRRPRLDAAWILDRFPPCLTPSDSQVGCARAPSRRV
jgi:hypothetical protein